MLFQTTNPHCHSPSPIGENSLMKSPKSRLGSSSLGTPIRYFSKSLVVHKLCDRLCFRSSIPSLIKLFNKLQSRVDICLCVFFLHTKTLTSVVFFILPQQVHPCLSVGAAVQQSGQLLSWQPQILTRMWPFLPSPVSWSTSRLAVSYTHLTLPTIYSV